VSARPYAQGAFVSKIDPDKRIRATICPWTNGIGEPGRGPNYQQKRGLGLSRVAFDAGVDDIKFKPKGFGRR
jgi:hypothetical protein